jgi:KaiC/GvpD/RAD55 family RecA-like ATPase
MRLASSGIPALDKLLGDGYPEKSAVLIVGPPGIGKEALGYRFTLTGIGQGDFSLYVTKRSVHDVLRDAKGFGVDYQNRVPFLMAREGGQVKIDINDLAGVSFNIKEVLRANQGRRIRIVMDIVSPLLILNPSETVYKFLAQLINDVKQYDAVMLVTMEEGMHSPQVMVAMQELFDGVIEVKVYEEGFKIVPILRIRKMIGGGPRPEYYRFSYSRESGVEVIPYAS